jgi:hypothetical protein
MTNFWFGKVTLNGQLWLLRGNRPNDMTKTFTINVPEEYRMTL